MKQALRALEQAKNAAEYMSAVAGLRDAAVTPLDPSAGLVRAGERSLPGSPVKGPAPMQPPEGAPDRGITERLGHSKPRGTVVGPGIIPTNSLGLVSSKNQNATEHAVTTVERTTGDGSGGTTHTTVTHDGGRVSRIETSHYDSDGNLISFDRVEYDQDGTQRHLHADVAGNPHTGGPVTTVDSWTVRGGQVDVHGADVQRPHSERLGDPPLQRDRRARYQPIEDTGGKEPAAWCNPISGHCYKKGIRTSSTYVNPGRGQPIQATGPLLVPRGIAVNPHPVGVDSARVPTQIPRTGQTPGARPPKPE